MVLEGLAHHHLHAPMLSSLWSQDKLAQHGKELWWVILTLEQRRAQVLCLSMLLGCLGAEINMHIFHLRVHGHCGIDRARAHPSADRGDRQY